jgi:hypothetical protein
MSINTLYKGDDDDDDGNNNNNNNENRAVYEITWKNIVELGRSQTTIWRSRFT